ncbi:MAG TPA: M14 metallopeptidase family protein [Bryobacteraceae bacterium]|nr:M14 metallopeptidase family protein [Bryobacteraceae bacterium]
MRYAALAFLLFTASAAVPTPESHFGHKIGVDNELLDWDKVVSYFQALEKSSDRIKFLELGKTVEGRPQIAAIISSPANLRNLEHYRDIQMRLADPRKTSPAEAAKLFGEGKTVVMITCSIHATEVASTHTAVEFAYRLLTEDNNPKFRAILDNVILILEPSQNPDGVDIVTRWYRKTRGTPYDGTSPPELYQHYVGHDDNRDWYIFTQPETRNTANLENRWHPEIVYDVHQMGSNQARLFVPPWLDPIDPNIDPILASLCNMIGTGVATDLTAAGKTGVAINAVYDAWTPARQYQAYHGGSRILTESASARLATPINITPDQITDRALGYNPRERSWNYLTPWMGGTWRLRDIIDYQSVAWESLLYQAAIRRTDMLRYFYEINQHNVERATPYAFVIPAAQNDPGAARKMLETLQFGETEIERASAGFTADGKQYAAGSYVVSMHQPYSGWAKTLLERQDYPDLREFPGGPPKRPYDVTAQTLPMLMGVDVATVKDSFRATLKPATEFSFALDHAEPAGTMAASDVDSWKDVAKMWKSREAVYRDPSTGDFFKVPGNGRKEVSAPRIGLYQSYMTSMDEGWTRWLFDDFGFAYTSLHDADIRAGNLRARFDAIVIPDQQAQQIADGHRAGTMPAEYCGGLGDAGAAALKEFAEQGGTLILFNHASDYATRALGVKAGNVLRGVANKDFYSPGSLLNVSLDTHSPLAYGMPAQITLWSEQSPAWNAEPGEVVARYPSSGVLASGWLLGEKYLTGKAALLDLASGRGHIILFGMRPQYRGQSYQNFKLLFNALVAYR